MSELVVTVALKGAKAESIKVVEVLGIVDGIVSTTLSVLFLQANPKTSNIEKLQVAKTHLVRPFLNRFRITKLSLAISRVNMKSAIEIQRNL